MSLFRISFYLTVSLLLPSCCSNLYYVNDPVVFGHMTKKSDFNFAGGVNVGNISAGYHLHGSTALTDKIFITGAYTSYSGGCGESSGTNGHASSTSVKYSGHSFLSGVGYYKLLGRKFYFEGLAGAKFGNNANVWSGERYEYLHMKYFLQPGITYTSPYFQAAFGLRFGFIDYLPYETGPQNTVPKIATNGVIPYMDPSFSFCAGGKYVKLGMQLSVTIADDPAIQYNPLGLFFGETSDALSFSLFLKVTIPSK